MYGVLYVVVEIVGQHLADVGWRQITTMDVATAVTDAGLLVAVVLATLLATKLGAQRWGPTVHAWWRRLGHPEVVWDDDILDVRSWRPAPAEIAAPPPQAPRAHSTYAGNPYSFGGRRWPAEPGRQL